MVSTGGIPELKDYVPAQDAVPVARLREAGANIIGKTNVPAFSGDWQSYNEIYGITSNPWNLDCTPGGSSGGRGGRHRGRTGRRRHRQRHWRLDPPPGAFLRPVRPQAESFGVVPSRGHIPRRAAGLQHGGPVRRRSARAQRRRSRAPVRYAGRRSGRSDAPASAIAALPGPKRRMTCVSRCGSTSRTPAPATEVAEAVREAAQAWRMQVRSRSTGRPAPDFTFNDNFRTTSLVLSAIISGRLPAQGS